MEFQIHGMPSAAELALAPPDAVESWALDVAGRARNGDDLTPAIELMTEANDLFVQLHGLQGPAEGMGR